MGIRTLLLKDVRGMIDLDSYGAEIFKNGSEVILHFKTDNGNLEADCLDALRSRGLNCCPERIPTNGYYRLSKKLPVWAGLY